MENVCLDLKKKIFNLIENLSYVRLTEVCSYIEKIVSDYPKSVKTSSSLDIKRQRFHAKNFIIQYNDAPLEDVKEILCKKFDGAAIEYIETNSLIIAHVKCSKEKKIEKSMKPLILNGHIPQIRTFGDLNITKICDINKKNEYDNFLIVLQNFLEFPNNDLVKSVENFLKIELSNIKILLYSEYVLSALFFRLVIDIGKNRSWEQFFLIGLDSKMEESVENYLFNFRCDLIFVIGTTLVIVEYKFRNSRKNNQKIKAINCIQSKYYGARVLNYLRNYQVDIFNQIKSVNFFGVGYSTFKRKIETGIDFEVISADNIKINEIFSSVKFLNFLKIKNADNFKYEKNFVGKNKIS